MNTIKQPDNANSQIWIQRIINDKDGLKKKLLEEHIGKGSLLWLSPLENESFKEYQLKDELIAKEFGFTENTFSAWWPRTGNQAVWDAIGKSSDNAIILIEAKAHLKETISPCHAGKKSYKLILDSFIALHEKLSSTTSSFNEDLWMKKYYQTANRLLFWHNIRKVCSVKLVFLNFVNVERSETSAQEWDDYNNIIIDALLGRSVKSLSDEIMYINFDVQKFI